MCVVQHTKRLQRDERDRIHQIGVQCYFVFDETSARNGNTNLFWLPIRADGIFLIRSAEQCNFGETYGPYEHTLAPHTYKLENTPHTHSHKCTIQIKQIQCNWMVESRWWNKTHLNGVEYKP